MRFMPRMDLEIDARMRATLVVYCPDCGSRLRHSLHTPASACTLACTCGSIFRFYGDLFECERQTGTVTA